MTPAKQQQIINRVLKHPVSSLCVIDNQIYVANPFIAFKFGDNLNNYKEKDTFRFDIAKIINFYKSKNKHLTTPSLKTVRDFYKSTPDKAYNLDGVLLDPYWLKSILEVMNPTIYCNNNAIYGVEDNNEVILMKIKGE